MSLSICVGAEQKPNESRAALSPEQALALQRIGFSVTVQDYANRIFPNSAYEKLGLPIVQSTEHAKFVVATKEWSQSKPLKCMHRGQVLFGFHHVHKEQPYNIQALQDAANLGVSLFDYELYRPNGTQLITTSRFAGIAGMVNALYTFGEVQRLRGARSACMSLHAPGQFNTTENLRAIVEKLLPITEDLRVLIVGTGVCGMGAREVCEWLQLPQRSAEEVRSASSTGPWFAQLRTEDYVGRVDDGGYNHAEYRTYGSERYRSTFDRYIGRHNVLVFCPYWDQGCPKLLPRELIRERHAEMPEVISDVTCDIEGSTECTMKESTVDNPIFTYDPHARVVDDGVLPGGLVVTAVDNLPAQIAASCTEVVGDALLHALPRLATADFDAPYGSSGLDDKISSAFILWRGKLTPHYQHLAKYL